MDFRRSPPSWGPKHTHTDQQQHSSEESLGLSGLQPEGEQSSDISRALLGRSERSAPYEFRGDLKSAFPNCSIHTAGIFINCHKKAGLACPHFWLKTTYSPPQMTRSPGTSLARKLTLIFDITTKCDLLNVMSDMYLAAQTSLQIRNVVRMKLGCSKHQNTL